MTQAFLIEESSLDFLSSASDMLPEDTLNVFNSLKNPLFSWRAREDSNS